MIRTLGAFSPSSPVAPDRLYFLRRNIADLEQAGVKVKLAPHALQPADHLVTPAATRISDIADLIKDPEIDALIATRGGKSAGTLLPALPYDLIQRAGKPMIGFSDTSAILNAVTARTGLVTYYGPNVLTKLHESECGLKAALIDKKCPLTRTSPNAFAIKGGTAEGVLVGGNLSTFAVCNSGTDYEPRFNGTILFWEAGNDDLRLIDQYLGALEVRGTTRQLTGMIIGKIGPREQPGALPFLQARLAQYTFPILWLPTFGHGRSINEPWPIGARARLSASDLSVHLHNPLI